MRTKQVPVLVADREIERCCSLSRISGKHFTGILRSGPSAALLQVDTSDPLRKSGLSAPEKSGSQRMNLHWKSRRLGRFAARNERALQPSRGRKPVSLEQADLDTKTIPAGWMTDKMLFSKILCWVSSRISATVFSLLRKRKAGYGREDSRSTVKKRGEKRKRRDGKVPGCRGKPIAAPRLSAFAFSFPVFSVALFFSPRSFVLSWERISGMVFFHF